MLRLIGSLSKIRSYNMRDKGISNMNVYRYEENPLVTPRDVKPHRDDFEVIGAFNAGIAQYEGKLSCSCVWQSVP